MISFSLGVYWYISNCFDSSSTKRLGHPRCFHTCQLIKTKVFLFLNMLNLCEYFWSKCILKPSELGENLYLRSRGVCLTYLDNIKIRQVEVSKQHHFVHRIKFFEFSYVNFLCKILWHHQPWDHKCILTVFPTK